jgi:predicted tellurium resistance membrane protein TerC
MNIKKEKIKMKIFLILYIVFAILVFIGAFMVITERVNNAGYSVIPMLFAIVFGILYRNSKKAIEENKQ